MLSTLMTLALMSPAHACPTVATGTPNKLTYDVARTAIVREGTRTTFTVSINPEGEQQSFALVMPVPGALSEGDVRVLDSGIFARLGGQTGMLTMDDAGCSYPNYDYNDPCWDAESDYASDAGGSDGSGGSYEDEYGDVTVESNFLVGGYEITVLSASESDDLFRYLNDNGYNLAEPTIPVIQDYLDEGMQFMTARVADEASAADGSPLQPLQIAYDSPMFGIPIRLAAASSPGQQDMLIYAITDPSAGRVGISNYDEMRVADTCIWNSPGSEYESGTFEDFYEDRFNAAWLEADQAGWSVEWAGESWSCSPCSGVTAEPADLAQLGWTGGDEHFLTRLHVRYTDETAGQDLVLYESGMRDGAVTSFANHNELNKWCVEPCQADLVEAHEAALDAAREQGQAEAARWRAERALECAEDQMWGNDDNDDDDDDDAGSSKRGGCAVAGGAASGVGALLALGLVARRRRES